jgi:hypothetical protein
MKMNIWALYLIMAEKANLKDQTKTIKSLG